MRFNNIVIRFFALCSLLFLNIATFGQDVLLDTTKTDTINPNNKTTKLLFEEIKTNIEANQDNNLFTFIMIGVVVLIVGIAMYISFGGKDEDE